MIRESSEYPSLWKEPVQERSRVRVTRMLEVAKKAIEEQGLSGLTMERVARGSEVPIGSLYQFFPDRNALLARLFTEFLDASIELVEARLRTVDSAESFLAATERLPEAIYREIAADTACAEIWRAVNSIRELRHLDALYSRAAANLIFDSCRPFAPVSVSDERLRGACFLVCDLLGAVTLAALEQGGRGAEVLVEEYVVMVRCYVQSIFGD